MNNSFIRKLLTSKTTSMMIVLVIFTSYFQFQNSLFLSPVNLRAIMSSMALNGIVTVGIACLQIGGGTNLAAGWEGMFGGQLAAMFLSTDFLGWESWQLALVFVLLFGVVAGCISSLFSNVMGFHPFIVTSAMGIVWRGLGMFLTNNQVASIPNQQFWKIGGTMFLNNTIPLPFIIMVCLMAIYGFMLTKTQFGRNIYLVGGNKQAARLAGVNPKAISTFLHINSSTISAFGGFVLASKMHMGNPQAFQGLETDAITACVLGGIAFAGGSGGMINCFIGLVMISAFSNGLLAMKADAYYSIILKGLLLVAALAIDTGTERLAAMSLRPPTDKQSKKQAEKMAL